MTHIPFANRPIRPGTTGRCGILAAILWLTASCTGLRPAGQHAAADEPVRAMTFNIRYGTANDGPDAWPNRRGLVIDVIRDFAPTVLGVQEALRFQLDEIARALPGYGIVGVGRDDGEERGEYSAILYDRARLEVLDSGTFWLSDTPEGPGSMTWGNRIPRIATWARLRLRSPPGTTFHVFNTHWDHESQPSRERSAALLLERIRARGARDPVLLMGDFNAGEDNAAFRALLAAQDPGLRDTFRDVHPQASGTGTYHAFRGDTSGARIDAILASPEWRTLDAAIVRVQENGRYPSDHFPVTATLVPGARGPPAARTTTRQEQFVDSILRLMTLEEKLGQLTQRAGRWGDTGPRVDEGGAAEIRAGGVGSFLGVYGAEYTRELQRIATEESRLRIPLLFAHDVIHGFRTIFPVPLAEASSWNPALVEQAARVGAIEATAHGLHWTFAPMVDIARDPRWGRIVEGSGEDPYLGSVMAAARVRGFQGAELTAPNTMLATAKHFVAYGAAEGGRDYNIADVPERTLREVYLPPFRAAVDAGARSIMAAFNEVAGVPMHAHRPLMRDLLRDEWGFDGILVSDWTGILELIPHGVAADSAHAGRIALDAGVDVDMVSGIYVRHLPQAVRSGTASEAQIDDAVRRVLRAKLDLGLFDDAYRYSDPERERTLTLAPEHIALARGMARESIVLLKNEGGTLPLRRDVRTIAVIGALADSARATLGGWAAAGREEDAVTVLDGIRVAAGTDTRVLYARGADVMSEDTSGFAAAVAAARQADVVVLVLGEHHDMSAEAFNRAWLDLPGVQLALAQRVHAVGRPVIAVLMNGRPLSIPWLDANVPAILETWFLGVQTGNAVADVLFGDYNPSGKLPVTFPRTVGQVPIYYAHKRTGRPPDPGNRYTSKYLDVDWTPLYPFGHGLSYTTFAYGEPRLDRATIAPGDTITVSVTVTNTGSRAGEEVVQLYIRDDVASVTRPVMELRGFDKVRLAPGEARTVAFRLGPDDLSFHGPDMRRIVEPGTFTVFVGGSSADTRQVRFTVEEGR
ncbi:MAG TPA: glycoside hydrolase family 3 N-terminal domain-containing protein [Longimicrobiales bacterium]